MAIEAGSGAIRQSVLALYGEITKSLNELNEGPKAGSSEAYDLRETAQEIVGLGGSAGEIGWYDEVLRYFDANRIGDERVVAPDFDDIIRDFTSEEQTLHPTWASRAIAAAYVLDRMAMEGLGPRGEPDLLALVLAAAPSEGPGFNESGKVGPLAAAGLSESLLGTRVNLRKEFFGETGEMRKMSGTLATAVASIDPISRLRKVKREYCAVVSTTAEWPDIDYTKLKKVIEPSNWDNFYQEFFCEMDVIGPDAQGWTRIHEAVSGECNRYRLDTGLKFWKAEHSGGLFINYDIDPKSTYTDKLVLVDNGYIWIRPRVPGHPDQGVRVKTSKELLISGMSATAMTMMAESMGYATNSTDMFYNAVKYKGPPVDNFTSSVPAKPAVPDTSLTWPVIVPELPPDLRDEFCADTTGLIKKRLDDAHELGCDFVARWNDGIDLNDFNYLNDKTAAKVKTAAKEAFDTATENFRPKMPGP